MACGQKTHTHDFIGAYGPTTSRFTFSEDAYKELWESLLLGQVMLERDGLIGRHSNETSTQVCHEHTETLVEFTCVTP
jgi:hypothetical protein